jgi:hypothetical protein
MDLRKFLEETEPEVLQKLAEDTQNELLESMLPLLEKTASYTAYLVMEKLAEMLDQHEGAQSVEDSTAPPIAGGAVTEAIPQTARGRENETVVANPESGGLDIKQVHDAVIEAIEVQQPDKIIPFVQAVSSAYPTLVNEVIKAVKTELHDAIMKKTIDEQKAIEISQALNSMVEG